MSNPHDIPATVELGDRLERDLRACELQLSDLGGNESFSGPIVTFRTPGDNLQLKDIVSHPGEGRVIVVDAGGDLSGAMLGDNMAARAASNGWSGIVVNGAVRDRRALQEIPLGIKALGTNPRRSRKEGAGEQNVEVSFGEVTFRPGEHLIADADGIVVLSAHPAELGLTS
jgi:regulator of ribonuclease activity A